MTLMIAGIALFFATHLYTAFARNSRAAIVGKIGEGAYKGLYSVLSLAAVILIVKGWSVADTTVVYALPYWIRHVTHLLTLIAFILLAAAYLPAGKIAEKTKHPMLAGVKLWAFGHLLVNGDVRSLFLFGAFLAYAVIDRIAVKKRGAPTRTAGAITNDLLAVGVGVAAWAGVAFYLHRHIAGVALFG